MGLITLPCFRRQPTWIDRPRIDPLCLKKSFVFGPQGPKSNQEILGFESQRIQQGSSQSNESKWFQWIPWIPHEPPMNPPWIPYEPPINPLSQPHHWMSFGAGPLTLQEWKTSQAIQVGDLHGRNDCSHCSPQLFFFFNNPQWSWDMSTINLTKAITKATYTPSYLLYLLEICAIAMEHSFFVGKSSNNMG